MLHYGAQLGLKTFTGRWDAFSGACGAGFTTGGGDVSWRTAAACRRRSRSACDGESRFCAPCMGDMQPVGDSVVTATRSCSEEGGGDVGGVKNSSSLDVS